MSVTFLPILMVGLYLLSGLVCFVSEMDKVSVLIAPAYMFWYGIVMAYIKFIEED